MRMERRANPEQGAGASVRRSVCAARGAAVVSRGVRKPAHQRAPRAQPTGPGTPPIERGDPAKHVAREERAASSTAAWAERGWPRQIWFFRARSPPSRARPAQLPPLPPLPVSAPAPRTLLSTLTTPPTFPHTQAAPLSPPLPPPPAERTPCIPAAARSPRGERVYRRLCPSITCGAGGRARWRAARRINYRGGRGQGLTASTHSTVVADSRTCGPARRP
jgi:hypothetical protein